MSAVVSWSTLAVALKNLARRPLVLVPFLSVLVGSLLFVLFYNYKRVQRERTSWNVVSYGKHYDKHFPYLGPLPYGYVWADTWKGRRQSHLWEHARDKALTELNKRFLARYNKLFWVKWSFNGSAKVKVKIHPAPEFWYDSGKPCEAFKASNPSPDVVGDQGRFFAQWDTHQERLIRADIFICDRKFEAGLLLRDKIDRNKVGSTLRRIGRQGILMHEMTHTLLGLAHPTKCMLMCRNPTGLSFSKHTWTLLDQTMRKHRDSKKNFH